MNPIPSNISVLQEGRLAPQTYYRLTPKTTEQFYFFPYLESSPLLFQSGFWNPTFCSGLCVFLSLLSKFAGVLRCSLAARVSVDQEYHHPLCLFFFIACAVWLFELCTNCCVFRDSSAEVFILLPLLRYLFHV